MQLGDIARSTLLGLVLVGSAWAGPISFSGQFDPSLATIITGGDGFVFTGSAPASITLVGSNTGSGRPILTAIIWTITSFVTELSFNWYYSTLDWAPHWDPAGYYYNGHYISPLDLEGPNVQSGRTSLPFLFPGDQFGFYVVTVDDFYGAATLTITGDTAVIPEPSTLLLLTVGGLGLLVWRRLSGSRAG